MYELYEALVNQRPQMTATTTTSLEEYEYLTPWNLTDEEAKVFNTTLQQYLESLIDKTSSAQSQDMEIPESLGKKIDEVFASLEFSSEGPKILGKEVVKKLLFAGFNDFTISRTGENEFLIYVHKNGSFKNILIDESGNIELILLPKEREKSKNIIYFKEDGLYLSRIMTAFNGM